MRYVLRADASQSIGAGHIMRSSAIAEELIARGEDVVFVGKITGLAWVEKRIAALGFTRIYDDPQGFISIAISDVLILDSYEIDIDDAFIAPANWLHIVVIVDELTPNYQCSLRIHPGLDSNWVGNSKVPILAGPKYIPLRSSLSHNVASGKQSGSPLKIAVVAGGSDSYNLVFTIANILSEFTELFEVYLFSNSISDKTLDSRFRYIPIGEKLDELTQDVDLVLTTSSTSSLEFIARGLCVGVACAVNNQEQYYKSLDQLGVAAQIGFRGPDNKWRLNKEMIRQLFTSLELRERLIAKAFGFVDFQGASRIADAILSL